MSSDDLYIRQYTGNEDDGEHYQSSQNGERVSPRHSSQDYSSLTSPSTSHLPYQTREPATSKSSHEPAASVLSTLSGISAPSSPSQPTGTFIATATGPSPVPSGVFTTSTTAVTVTTTAASTSQSSAVVNHGLNGRKIAAILVPVLVLLAIIPILYICYLRRRSKRDLRALPELHLPPETQLLESRHNSISLTSPFSDTERIRSNSLGLSDRPSSETSRAPSPILPSPSIPTFHVRESWPLSSSKALPDPPLAYNPHSSNLRPPSSTHSRVSSVSRSSSYAGTGTERDRGTPQNPFANRASDTVSELSFDQGSQGRRTRDLDELSFVSAVDSEDNVPERSPRYMI
ncbi:MAG: hypothetical protein Q9187_002097 [Circinaria calcarea]